MKVQYRIAIPAAAFIVAAGPTASAQEMDADMLSSPNVTSIEIGVIGAFGSKAETGKYTGLADYSALPIVNGTYIKRDDGTGTWMRAMGVDLGLSDRELRLEYERQGTWKLFVDLNQIHKTNPLKVETKLTGADSNNQTTGGTSLREMELKTDRYNGTVELTRSFAKGFDLQVSFRAENKDGKRQFGVGSSPTFLVDPIDQTVYELGGKVNYTGNQLQVSGGFLASIFDNKYSALYSDVVTTGIALPPDNEAYNFYVDGGYSFTPDTRAAAKVSYTRMTQTETFYAATGGLSGNDRTNLGGEVDKYLATGSVRSRVTTDLTLRGKFRYEGSHDNTPIVQYLTANTRRTGYYFQLDRDRATATGQADYRLPADYLLTGTVQYEHFRRNYPTLRQSSWRARTDELLGGAKVSKRLTETLGGSLGYSYSQRNGSSFVESGSGTNIIDPINWGDRDRHKWQLKVNWAPAPAWSVQARVDGSLDTYYSSERVMGPDNGGTNNASVDASYQINSEWSLNAFVSRNEVRRKQTTVDNEGSVTGQWTAKMRNLGYSGGIGVHGKPMTGLKVGADIQYSYDKNEYNLASGTPEIVSLPDAAYRQLDLKLMTDYAVSENSSVVFRYQYTHLENSDFTYDINVFTDDTIITLPDHENSHFVGVSYRYRW